MAHSLLLFTVSAGRRKQAPSIRAPGVSAHKATASSESTSRLSSQALLEPFDVGADLDGLGRELGVLHQERREHKNVRQRMPATDQVDVDARPLLFSPLPLRCESTIE
jgi:hypothetical protein